MAALHRRRAVAAPDPDHVDALDVVRPVTNVGVIATHTTQAIAGANVASTIALAGLHATRHIFFLVSGISLVYAHYDDERFSALSFWRRRLGLVVVPYVIWSIVYYLVSATSLTGLDMTAKPTPDTFVNRLHQLGGLLVTGTGHLYFIVVLIQYYVLFPLVLLVLRATHRWHVLVFAISLLGQLVIDEAVHRHDVPSVFLGISGNRQILLYEFYLIGGGIIGAHLREIEAALWRFRLIVAPVSAALCVVIELHALHQLHEGVSIAVVGDPFAPIFVFFNLAAFALLYLMGMWWSRCGITVLRRLVRSASDNSYGAYLVHAFFLDTFVMVLFAPYVQDGGSRSLAIVACVALTYACALLLSSVLTRTPLALATVSRARRPVFGGSDPVGHGTKGTRPMARRRQARRSSGGAADERHGEAAKV